MVVREAYPTGRSSRYKKNGHTRHGKHKQRCTACGRQLTVDAVDQGMAHEHRMQITQLWCERVSLRGICRAVGVSLTWLLHCRAECLTACPAHGYAQRPAWLTEVLLSRVATDADERGRFVQKKANKPWGWIAMDATQVGNRNRESGKALWTTIPLVYREQAMFHTDHYAVSQGVIPAEQHKASTKHARTTNPIERCNNTLRQRVSRLVRATLSCSTKLAHHIGSPKCFLCQDHLTKGGAFPV